MNEKNKPDDKPEKPEPLDLSTLSEEEIEELMKQALDDLPPVPEAVLDRKTDKPEKSSFSAKIARKPTDRGR